MYVCACTMCACVRADIRAQMNKEKKKVQNKRRNRRVKSQLCYTDLLQCLSQRLPLKLMMRLHALHHVAQLRHLAVPSISGTAQLVLQVHLNHLTLPNSLLGSITIIIVRGRMLVSAYTSITFGVEVQKGLLSSLSLMILKQNVRRKKTSLDDDETRPRHSRNNPKTNQKLWCQTQANKYRCRSTCLDKV